MVVLLPAPFGPRKPKKRPRATWKVSRSTAGLPRKTLVSPRATMASGGGCRGRRRVRRTAGPASRSSGSPSSVVNPFYRTGAGPAGGASGNVESAGMAPSREERPPRHERAQAAGTARRHHHEAGQADGGEGGEHRQQDPQQRPAGGEGPPAAVHGSAAQPARDTITATEYAKRFSSKTRSAGLFVVHLCSHPRSLAPPSRRRPVSGYGVGPCPRSTACCRCTTATKCTRSRCARRPDA